MSKKHLTAMGKQIDMAALRAKNEMVRAVGNMNVNARGDIIDSHNNVINDSNKRVNVMYQKTMQSVPAKQIATAPNTKKRESIISEELSDQEKNTQEFDEPNPEK